jgi:hypothetical protein
MMRVGKGAVLTFALLGTLAACADHQIGDEGHPPKNATHVAPGADTSRARAEAWLAERANLQPGALQSVHSALVEGFSGPGGQPFEVTLRTDAATSANARRFGTITMQNSMRERSGGVGSYPCTSCHLGRRIVMNDERIEDAHRNIQPNHPERTGAICSTCHLADNVEMLTLRTGERASLDHTYRLCAQCHFTQADAWAGGAHGKRLDGWQGRRIVMGCADCHDPHQPAIETRIPFRAPRLHRVRSETNE